MPLQVGEDDQAYDRLLNTMDLSQVATMARIIMVNPLHKDYPQIVIHIQVCIILYNNIQSFLS